MLKKYDIKSYEKIIVLIAVLILPAEGNTQANNNKIINNPQNIRNPPPKQKQIKKAKKPQGELLKSKKLHMTPKELQEKLLFVNTGLANATKSIKELEKKLLVSNAEIEKAIKEVAKRDGEIIKLNQDINTLLDQLDDLDEDLIVKEDTSKKYKGLVDCYRAALFSWYDMNGKKGLTERDHLVINIQLRTSLFNCPPI